MINFIKNTWVWVKERSKKFWGFLAVIVVGSVVLAAPLLTNPPDTYIYLASWEWMTEDDASFWICPGASCTGTLDLRTIPEMSMPGGIPQGYGIFLYPSEKTIPGALFLGNDLDEILTPSVKSQVEARFKITMTSQTSLEVMWDMATKYSDPTGQNAPKPLMPSSKSELSMYFGNQKVRNEVFDILTHPHKDKVIALIQLDYRKIRNQALAKPMGNRERDTYKRVLDFWREKYAVDYKIFIPNDLPDEGILPHQTILKDNFNRTNSATLGTSSEGWSWTEVGGNIDIVSNKASQQSSGNDARAGSDLDGVDQYSQVDVFTNVNADAGAVVRFNDSSQEFYGFEFGIGSRSDYQIIKHFSVTETILIFSANTTDDALARIEVVGSNLEGFQDGASKLTTTDMSITGNKKTGIKLRAQGANRAQVDNFESGDIVTAITTATSTSQVIDWF